MIFQFSGYVGLVAAFVIIGLICDFFGTFLTGLGLRSTDPNKKYKYYRVAIYALVVARESFILASTFFQTKNFFSQKENMFLIRMLETFFYIRCSLKAFYLLIIIAFHDFTCRFFIINYCTDIYFAFSVILLVLAAIIYPVSFSKDLAKGEQFHL